MSGVRLFLSSSTGFILTLVAASAAFSPKILAVLAARTLSVAILLIFSALASVDRGEPRTR